MKLASARVLRRFGCGLALVGSAACRGAPADLPGLAERPPLPCSVLVTGGAFIEPPHAVPAGQPRARTFPDDDQEAVGLAAFSGVLARGRVFVRAETDDRDVATRARVAAATGAAELDDLLVLARAAGHDYLLVVERVDDGPIEPLGINGQWPITLMTWLLVGLGMVIPDHGYESRASLRASLRDVHDGHTVQELVIGTGTIELSLLERTAFWGIVQSILIPPFWVGDDDDCVVAEVRAVVQQRFLVGLAQRLKSVDVADRVARSQPASVTLRRAGAGLAIEVLAQETISFLRLRLDDRVLEGPDFDRFHRAFLASRATTDVALSYGAELPVVPSGLRLQVLVQTINGRVGSVSMDLRDLP